MQEDRGLKAEGRDDRNNLGVVWKWLMKQGSYTGQGDGDMSKITADAQKIKAKQQELQSDVQG